eukprot:TRINITY_DN102657_c0_g1_i1.p1 TRINITY_DN102657_c0_g1~~TRINITY_DN102657_c0_g1_i1.p1  ORF type:complete len:193 (+),score=8.48 TRINITY_DN102657_c0_g1_i1:264-842(+)
MASLAKAFAILVAACRVAYQVRATAASDACIEGESSSCESSSLLQVDLAFTHTDPVTASSLLQFKGVVINGANRVDERALEEGDSNDSREQPWIVKSGECRIAKDCLTSPNYPDKYGASQSCVIAINPKGFPGTLKTEIFKTESMYDVLTINGQEYSGRQGPPDKTSPEGVIEWLSDDSVARQGWKLCRINA